MDTEQLERFASRHVSDFDGVYPADELPDLDAERFCFIANTAPRSHPGLHWVLFHRAGPNREMNYFCSYGTAATDVSFANLPDRYLESEYRLQSAGTSVCGQYCLYYAHQLANEGRSLGEISDDFYTNTAKNDALVEQWVERQSLNLMDWDLHVLARQT